MAVATFTRAAKKDSTTAYAALVYTDGIRIYKTDNQGATWSLVSVQPGIPGIVSALGVIPNTDILLLATCSTSYWNIYKSTDGGVNFTLKGSREVWSSAGSADSAFCFLGNGVILTEIPVPASSQSPVYHICRSTDNGDTWSYIAVGDSYTPLNVMDIIEVAGGIVLAVGASAYSGSQTNAKVIRSTDGGVSWNNIITQTVSGGVYVTYTQLSNGKIFWALSYVHTLFYSEDLGVTWKTKNLPMDIVRLTSTKNRLIASTWDRKIYISDNEGDTWQVVATTDTGIIDFILF